MALKRSQIGRINLNGTVVDVRNIEIDMGSNVSTQRHSGLTEATNALVSSAVISRISFTTSLSTALDAIGLGVTEYSALDDVEAVLANMVGASIQAGSVHTKYSKEAGALASAFIDSIEAQEGGEATASVFIYYYSDDGDTAPLEQTGSVAFPALTAVPTIHTIGPFTFNGSLIDGATGFSYQSGLTLSFQPTDGKIFITGAFVSAFDRRISVAASDPIGVTAVLDLVGKKITSTTSVVFFKSDNDIPTASGAKTFTIAAGFVQPSSASGSQGDQFTNGVEIIPVSTDGTTIPIVVS